MQNEVDESQAASETQCTGMSIVGSGMYMHRSRSWNEPMSAVALCASLKGSYTSAAEEAG